MDKQNKKYVIFVSIVILAIILMALAFIFINQPNIVPTISTISDINKSSNNTSTIEDTDTNTQLSVTNVTNKAAFPLDINTASKSQLMQLDGIGEVIADRIIQYRSSGNYFHSIDEIKNVKGIGDSIFEKIKDNIYVNSNEVPSKDIQEITSTASKAATIPAITTKAVTTFKPITTTQMETLMTAAKLQVEFPLDINSASAEELMCLNGIGSVLANRIIAYRNENIGFYSIEELMNVNGIGENTFNKIKWQIWADTSKLPEKSTTTFDETTTKASTTARETQSTTVAISIININTATVNDFEKLPKMNKVIAQNIVTMRDKTMGGSFSSIYEILYADGMTESIFNAIKPYLTV